MPFINTSSTAKRRQNPRSFGTKVAAHYRLQIPAGAEVQVRLRLYAEPETPPELFGDGFRRTLAERVAEGDEFYAQVIPGELGPAERLVARQAYAGLLWTKRSKRYS